MTPDDFKRILREYETERPLSLSDWAVLAIIVFAVLLLMTAVFSRWPL